MQKQNKRETAKAVSLFWLIWHFCRKTNSFSVFVVVVFPKLLYNKTVKTGSMLKIRRRNTE